MEVLPTEIITEIFSYLDIMELKKMEISKKIKKIVRENKWEKITIKMTQTNKTKYLINNYSFIKYRLNQDITDEDLKLLKKCCALNLSGCFRTTDDSMKLFKNCHTLILNNCYNITDKSVKLLKNCHTVDLFHCKITDESIKLLKNCSRINVLQHINSKLRKDMCKAHIFAALRECPMDTRSECPRTHTLILYNCKNITDKSVKYLKKCHTLDISHCTKITNHSVKYLKNCHTLRLSGCFQITDESIKLLKNCHALDFSYCDKVTDESVKLLKNCHTLNFSGCYKITNESIKELNCKNLLFDNYNNISDDTFWHLKNKGINLYQNM